MSEERNRGGRPAIGPPIQVRLPADLVARLDDRADAEGVTRSDLIRRGIDLVLATRSPAR